MTLCPCTSKRPKDTILCINRITWWLAFSIWWLEHVVLKKISSSSVYIDHVKNKCEKKKHQHSMIVRTWLVDRIDSICIATPRQSIIWTSFGDKCQGIVLCLYQKKIPRWICPTSWSWMKRCKQSYITSRGIWIIKSKKNREDI